MTPLTPDLVTWLILRLRDSLPDTYVGQRRPPDVVNYASQLVRVTCTGGPLSWGGHLWSPVAVLECWADDGDAAHDLGAAATRALLALEGTVDDGVLHLSEVDVMVACADTPIDGHPVVTTTAALTVALPMEGTP